LRLVVAFTSSVLVCGLLILGAKSVLPTKADEDSCDNVTGNFMETITNLLPDIETIYRESLTTPFIKTESKIYDEDIAEYNFELLDRTGIHPKAEGTD
jgi:hypothetical protein